MKKHFKWAWPEIVQRLLLLVALFVMARRPGAGQHPRGGHDPLGGGPVPPDGVQRFRRGGSD
jgi:hypothetical protein